MSTTSGINKKNKLIETKNLYIESYGCAMNVSDSEIVASIMKKNNFNIIDNYEEANAIFINTCAIRAKAEETIRNRLTQFNKQKKKILLL